MNVSLMFVFSGDFSFETGLLSPIRKDTKLLTIAFFLVLTPPYCSHLLGTLRSDDGDGYWNATKAISLD